MVRNRTGATKTNPRHIGRDHLDRVNFLIGEQAGMPILTLLEAFLQCRLKPTYEGFKSQRL